MTVRLLDGGMGQALYRAMPDERLWSTRAVLDAPHLVRDLHERFLRAGADIITTATYSATRWRMIRAGAVDRWAEANRSACAAAEAARDAVNPAALVAGSLPPLRGSYQPERVPTPETLEAEYAEQALMLAPSVDLFIAETLASSVEAVAAVRAAATTGKPVWVAYTVTDDGARLRSGQSVEAAVRALDGLPVAAVLLNCAPPEAIDVAIRALARVAGSLPFGAYGNGFAEIPPDFGFGSAVADLVRRDINPDAYAAHAVRWIEAGAGIVGGCCEIDPPHIERLAHVVRGTRR